MIPVRYRDVMLTDLPKHPVLESAVKYLQQFEEVRASGLAPVYVGRARQYKTTAAALIARELEARWGLGVQWVNAPDQIGAAARARFAATTQASIESWKQAEFLVVDDFYEVKPDSQAGELVKELMAGRFDRMLPTLWTGNVVLSERDVISREWGPSFARRLADSGKGFTVVLK